MRKIALLILIIIVPIIGFSQESNDQRAFFNNLKKHAGKAYQGTVTAGAKKDDSFSTERLVMHVRSCEENQIRIPLSVGEDKSRTWILTLEGGRMLLKHDHRLPDGSEDKTTMYGGWTSNTGNSNMQIFPADQHTCDVKKDWGHNTWWITVDETSLTYNLRRLGTPRIFTITFDLTKEVETPSAPWGWED